MNFLDLFRAARRVSTPLIAVRTADPGATQNTLVEALTKDADDKQKPAPAFLAWDVMRGCQWANPAGMLAAYQVLLERDPNLNRPDTPERVEEARNELKLKTGNLVEVLDKAEKLPAGTILFLYNSQRYLDKADVIQGIWNLRDLFKQDRRILVLLGSLSLTLPAELSQDVLILDDPLPTLAQLEEIVRQQFANAGADQPDGKIVAQAVDAVCGLAAFPAEQITAMSFSGANGGVTLDTEALWERKRQLISQVRGLSVWRKGETYKDVGGSDSIKQFLTRIMTGAEPPRVLILLDEFEKAMAGTSAEAGDSSGTKQEMHGTLLSEMEDQDYTGLILFGAPGCSKTLIVKATGGEFAIPVIVMSIPDMLEKFVGSSNENLRTALNIIRATSQGRAFFLATCNAMINISGPLRRRFSYGQWMFDLPAKEEREMIWPIHRKKYGLKEQDLPADEGWTGAEIRNCCKMAYQMRASLKQAAEFIVPVSRTMAEEIDKMRQSANGRFKSASYPGFYQLNRPAAATTPAGGKRAIALEG